MHVCCYFEIVTANAETQLDSLTQFAIRIYARRLQGNQFLICCTSNENFVSPEIVLDRHALCMHKTHKHRTHRGAVVLCMRRSTRAKINSSHKRVTFYSARNSIHISCEDCFSRWVPSASVSAESAPKTVSLPCCHARPSAGPTPFTRWVFDAAEGCRCVNCRLVEVDTS